MKTNRGLITTCELDNNFSLALSLAPPAPLLFLDFPPSYLHLPPLPSHLRLDLSLSLSIRLYTRSNLDSQLFSRFYSLLPVAIHPPPSITTPLSTHLSLFLFDSIFCFLPLTSPLPASSFSLSLSLLVLVSRLLA